MLKRVVWITSFFFTILFIAITAYIILDTHTHYNPYLSKIDSSQKAETYIKNYLQKYYSDSLHIYTVPTGLYIESLKFVSPYSVHMSGYIWQKYDASYPKNFLKGFIFAATTNLKLVLSYEEKNGTHLMGWYFDGDFTQSFDYSKYPLDYKIVRIRIWPKDFENPIVLVPDFSSYSLKRSTTFGLDPRIILQGYSVLETFYAYFISDYDTNFGLKYVVDAKDFPELYFNIPLKRNILSALIVNLLPLLIVLILSFGLLKIMSHKEDVRRKYGFQPSGLVNFCAGMLFVVVLAHIRLREAITYDNLMYLESVYFVVYFGLVYIAVLGFLVMIEHKKHKWIEFIFYEDCLLLKALYLPLMFGLILWITVVFLK